MLFPGRLIRAPPSHGRARDPSAVLDGLLLVLWLTAAVRVLGVLFGTVLAVMRPSANPTLTAVIGLTLHETAC
nr:hypothetical protein [Streptomyces sp. AP-93]